MDQYLNESVIANCFCNRNSENYIIEIDETFVKQTNLVESPPLSVKEKINEWLEWSHYPHISHHSNSLENAPNSDMEISDTTSDINSQYSSSKASSLNPNNRSNSINLDEILPFLLLLPSVIGEDCSDPPHPPDASDKKVTFQDQESPQPTEDNKTDLSSPPSTTAENKGIKILKPSKFRMFIGAVRLAGRAVFRRMACFGNCKC